MNDITRETKGQAEREREKKVNGKNLQLAQPDPTLTQGGHKIASLLN